MANIVNITASNLPCPYCGKFMNARGVKGSPSPHKNPLYPTREHLVPLSKARGKKAGKFIMVCLKCNNDKGSLTLEMWYHRLNVYKDSRALIVKQFMINSDLWKEPKNVTQSLQDFNKNSQRSLTRQNLTNDQTTVLRYILENFKNEWVSVYDISNNVKLTDENKTASEMLHKLFLKGWLIVKEKDPLDVSPLQYRLSDIAADEEYKIIMETLVG